MSYYFPGLVAVLLYHDGRRCLLSALRTLLQSREGLTWTLELDEEMSGLILSFTKQMIDEGKAECSNFERYFYENTSPQCFSNLRFLGLVTKLLDLLGELTLQTELKKLQDGQAIGNEKHQRQLIDLITEQRLLLAESLFCIACQTPLSKAETLKVFSYLKNVSPNEETGEIDQADLFVFFTLLYSLNVSSLETQSEMAANNGRSYVYVYSVYSSSSVFSFSQLAK